MGLPTGNIIINMDRNAFFEQIKDKLLKVAANPLIKEKRELDTRQISFEDMWETLGKEKFTGYLMAGTHEYKWHTFVIDGHVRFSAFLGKGIVLRGKEALLSMKSKWNNPPVTVTALKLSPEALMAYYGMFSGLKVFDGINPETIGIDRVFQKLEEEKFTGTAIFNSKDNKIVFLWHTGNILHIFPMRNISLSVDEETLKEVIVSPFLSITAIKSHSMSLNLPYDKLLYTKRAAEINALLKCFQDRLADVIGNRLITLIANDTKEKLIQRHPFYADLLQIKDGRIFMEPKVMDKGVSSDFDDVIKEILEVYVARANEDAGRYLVKRFFKECKEKGARKGEESN